MADKLSILLFKILICTLLISFKTKSQLVDGKSNLTEEELEGAESISSKQIYNIKSNESLSSQRIKNRKMDESGYRKKIKEWELYESLASQRIKKEKEDEAGFRKKMEKELEIVKNQENIFDDKIFKKHEKILHDMEEEEEEEKQEDIASKLIGFEKVEFKPVDFKLNYRGDFSSLNASDVPYLILAYFTYFAIAIGIGLFASLVAHCVKKRRRTLVANCVKKRMRTPSPSDKFFHWWLTIKNTESDQEETPGDGSGSQESSGDKSRLINV